MDGSLKPGARRHSCTLVSVRCTRLSKCQPISAPPHGTSRLHHEPRGTTECVHMCAHLPTNTRMYIQRTNLYLYDQLQFTKCSRNTGCIQKSKRVGLLLCSATATSPSRFRALHPPLPIGDYCGQPQRRKLFKSVSTRAGSKKQTCKAPILGYLAKKPVLKASVAPRTPGLAEGIS